LAERAAVATGPALADGRSSLRRGPEAREAIHVAAIELFARRGYHATSMRALASAARVQPAAIYHWYPNKEAILVQLQDDFMARLTARVTAAIGAQPSAALQLAAAVREHVVFHGVNRLAAFVTDSEIRALTDEPRAALVAKRDGYQAIFSGLIRDGIRDGSLRSSDAQVATYAILHKVEDEDSGEISDTNVACKLLDTGTARCTDYKNRKAFVPDCLRLTLKIVKDVPWLPDSCAYRRRAAGKPLPEWHYLVSGDRDAVIRAGVSVIGRVVSETEAGPLEHHLVEWTDAERGSG
jgi:uncharacterized cysteine cluster protein YcgN (CxxCxxCC family)